MSPNILCTCKIFLICVSLLIHLKESKPISLYLLFGGFNDFMSKKSPVLWCSVFTRYSVLNMVMQRCALWKFLKTFRKLDHITKCSKNVWYEKETGDHWFYKAVCPVFSERFCSVGITKGVVRSRYNTGHGIRLAGRESQISQCALLVMPREWTSRKRTDEEKKEFISKTKDLASIYSSSTY